MEERIQIDMLTQDSVSVKKQKFIKYNELEYPLGEPWRKSYLNSAKGREEIQKDLDKKYVDIVFTMWGDTPTVEETITQ